MLTEITASDWSLLMKRVLPELKMMMGLKVAGQTL